MVVLTAVLRMNSVCTNCRRSFSCGQTYAYIYVYVHVHIQTNSAITGTPTHLEGDGGRGAGVQDPAVQHFLGNHTRLLEGIGIMSGYEVDYVRVEGTDDRDIQYKSGQRKHLTNTVTSHMNYIRTEAAQVGPYSPQCLNIWP